MQEMPSKALTIEPGQYYRRKSDGAKLMALETAISLRARCYDYSTCGITYAGVSDVEPWREPLKKKVTAYAWLCKGGAIYLQRDAPPPAYDGDSDPVIGYSVATIEVEEGRFG